MRAIRRSIGYLGLGLLLACVTVTEQEIRQAQAHRDLGAMHLQRGELELAIREYRHAIKVYPRGAEAHFGVGEAYRRKGEAALAEKHLQKALVYDPELLDARLNLGALYIEQERFEDAIRENRLLLEDPTFLLPERALVNLAWAEYKSGDTTVAEQHLREAVGVNRRSFQAHLNLGIVLSEKGEHVEAATHLEKVLDILKDRQPQLFAYVEAETRFRLGVAYVKLGQREKALEHLRVASERGGAGEWGKRSREYLRVIE
jgi:tetratricopeptide (TPR) repeat protein